jgi:hypothetical protein
MSSVSLVGPRADATLRFARYVLAFFPNTLIGLLVAFVGLFTRSRYAAVDGVLEVHGGAAKWFLKMGIPGIGPMPAMTLGHVVIAVDQTTLDRWRVHERVHVRQFEIWGPLMLPAMLVSALCQSIQGRDPYYDNLFEREAYAVEGSPYEASTRPRRTKPADSTKPVVPALEQAA